MKFNERGEELPDPTPKSVPGGFKEAESVQAMIQRLVHTVVSEHASRRGFETVDEANDFDIEDDEFPETKYEVLGDERLEETHRAIVDSRAAARYSGKDRRARRNAPSARNASEAEPDVNSDVSSRSGVRDLGERGSSGARSMGSGVRTQGGSGEDPEGRPTRTGESR